jgi:predicted nucleic acid-binding protein
VLDEASAGDPQAAQERLTALNSVPVLKITADARDLAKQLIQSTPLPEKAAVDALHIATATVHGMDYLLTWNCRHIANATFRSSMRIICENAGYAIPVICTPLELIEDQNHD